jgi:hypothetical protein
VGGTGLAVGTDGVFVSAGGEVVFWQPLSPHMVASPIASMMMVMEFRFLHMG